MKKTYPSLLLHEFDREIRIAALGDRNHVRPAVRLVEHDETVQPFQGLDPFPAAI